LTVGGNNFSNGFQSNELVEKATRIPALPKDLACKSLKHILSELDQGIEDEITLFSQQAEKIVQWDLSLKENEKSIETLLDDVHFLMVAQEEIDDLCNSIQMHQDDFDSTLEELKRGVDEEIKKFQESNVVQQADKERHDMYYLAADLNAYLDKLDTNLQKTVDDFNESRGGEQVAASYSDSPMSQIIKILNSHHDSLSWIDHKSAEVKRKLAHINRNLRY